MDPFPSSSFTNVTAVVSWHCLTCGEGEESLSKSLTIQTQLLQQGILATVQVVPPLSEGTTTAAAAATTTTTTTTTAGMMMESEVEAPAPSNAGVGGHMGSGSGGVELWVFQSPASAEFSLPQSALSLLVEFEGSFVHPHKVKSTGTCVVEQETQVSLFLQAVNHLVARQLTANGFFRFGNSFLLPKAPDSPSISCKITPQWSGSSMLFLTFVEQIRLRQIKLRDLTSKFSKEIPYFLCPTGERVRVLRNQNSPPASQRIFDEWVFYFGFEREFLESNQEFGMPLTVTCLLGDKQIEVPSKCLFTFTHWNPCESSSPPPGDLFRQFWLNNFVFLQNIMGDHSASVSLAQPCRSILASSIPDPLSPLPAEIFPRDGASGEKQKIPGLVTKKTILEFSSKFQPKVPADVITPQQDPVQSHPLSVTYTNKVSTLDMKLEDLDSNLDEFNIENELSEFFSDSRAAADKSSLSLTSPQVDPPSQTPQADFASGTPSSHFQSMHSPQFEQTAIPPPSSVPPTLTPSAQITFTPGAVSSPIFSPAQLQGASSVPPSQAQEPSPSSFANTPPSSSGAPLPSERYIRPTIYSPLNITFGNLVPRFSPLKAGNAAGGASQTKSGAKPATPITPGSEAQLSGDDNSDSDFEEEEENLRGGDFPVIELCFGIDAMADDTPLQHGYEAYLRELELLPAASATSPATPPSLVNTDLSEDFLAALKIHVGGLFSGCLPTTIDPSLLGPEDEPHFPPIRTSVPQEGAFRVLFMLQSLFGATFGDPRKGTRGLLTLLQYAELLDLDCTSSQYEKNPLFRRKRKTESKVEALPHPDVVVGQDDSWLKVSARALNLWEKASFLPYSPQKEFRYFVVVPKNPYLVNLMGSFFRDLSSVFDNCQLGSHKPGGLTQTSQKNLFPISLDSAALQVKEDRLKELSRLYAEIAPILGRTLQAIESTIPADTFVVIYFISPLLGEDCSLLLCEAFSKGVSLEHLVGYPAHGPTNSSNLRDLAFSVYTKARPLLRRTDPFSIQRPGPMKKDDYSLFAPPVTLYRTSSPKVRYNVVAQPATFGWEKLLHVCYNVSPDRRWVAVSWTDDRGELLEVDLLNFSEQGSDRSVFSKIWRQTSNLTRVTSFPWRIVLCKVGVLSSPEYEDWMAVLQECTEHLRGSWQASTNAPFQSSPSPAGDFDNINSLSLCWLAPFSSLQVFEPFFSPSKGPSKDMPLMTAAPQAAPAPRVLVSTQRVSFTHGAAAPLSNGLLCEASMGSQSEVLPWPRALEVSLVFHQAGSVTTASNSSFRTWSGEGVTMDSILRDICLQYHALSFLGFLSPTGRATDLLPFHARVTARILKLVGNSGLQQAITKPTSGSSLAPASASTPSFPPSASSSSQVFPMYYE